MAKKNSRIQTLLKTAEELSRDLSRYLKNVQDYDLKRLLKKVDADMMDVRYNLQLAARLVDGPDKK